MELDLYKMFSLKNRYPYYNSKGMSGLINLGNTCFFNSIIQCLSHSIRLTDYFLSKKHLEDEASHRIPPSEEKTFINIYFNLLVKLWEKNDIVNARNAINTLAKIVKKKSYLTSQQDSHECLVYLLNVLHKGLSYKVEMEITGEVKTDRDKLIRQLYTNYQANFEKNYSVIANLFYGEIINIIDCSKCNYNNNVFELFNTLTLNFPECEPNKNLNITELISHTLKTETIENYHCEGCKSEGCNRKNYIMRLPNYLIVHLNRFKKTDKQIEKINNLVEFPIENLDLTEYFHPSEPNNWIYSLYAVNYHSGTTQNGHYWSACHNLDDNWYIYNDENVNKFLNNGSIVTNEAYILFYYRKYIDKKN